MVSIKIAGFKTFNEGLVLPNAIWSIKDPCNTLHMPSGKS